MPRPRRRGETPARALTAILIGLAVLGGAASALAVARVHDDVAAADEQASALVVERLAANLSGTPGAFAGTDVMAVDGEVSAEEFAAYAADVMPGRGLSAIADAEVVDAGERADWETQVGAPMIAGDGDGGFAPAPGRDEHVVVRFVHPVTDLTTSIIGFDISSEQIRARGVTEAATSDTPVVVGPIRLARTAAPGLFAVDAVRTPDGTILGYVSSGISADLPLDPVRELPGVDGITVTVDSEPFVGFGHRATREVTFRLGGRTFVVAVDDARPASWWLPGVVALGTLLLCLAAALVARRASAERRRQAALAVRGERLAELADELGGAASSRSVTRVTMRLGRQVVDAEWVLVGLLDPTDPSKMVVRGPSSADHDHAAVLTRTFDVADDHPLARCLRTGREVRADPGSHVLGEASVLTDADAGLLCAPLGLGSASTPWGAIAFGWQGPPGGRRPDDAADAARLVAQLVGRAFERALVREVLQERVQLLSDFARALTGSRTTSDIEEVVSGLLPALLDVERARLQPEPVPDTDRVRCFRPASPDGEHLVLTLRRDRTDWNATSDAVVQAVLELVDGGWSRAKLYDHEHSVLERLQWSILTDPPPVEEFRIRVAYRSAIESVGIGGDWYSLVDHGDHLFAVIGDIAGHGPGAVALMAEVKSIIRHLLGAGTSLPDVVQHTHANLSRRSADASAVVACLDKRSGEVTYINAGHPFPIVVGPDSTRLLHELHRPWLGVDAPSVEPSTAHLEPGSTLLLYTDGLVKERGTAIDESIDGLVHRASASVPRRPVTAASASIGRCARGCGMGHDRGMTDRHDATAEQLLVGVAFDTPFRAQEFLVAVTGLAAGGRLKLKDAVMVSKDDRGHTTAKETIDPTPGRAALSGAVWSGLFGLILGGPVGWIAGLAVGAGAGAVSAKVVDLGIPDEWVAWFREAVRPGTVTVVLLVEQLDRNALIAEVARFPGAELVHATLDDTTVARLREALGEPVDDPTTDPTTDPAADPTTDGEAAVDEPT